jgi:hypothetical protein
MGTAKNWKAEYRAIAGGFDPATQSFDLTGQDAKSATQTTSNFGGLLGDPANIALFGIFAWAWRATFVKTWINARRALQNDPN